MQGIIEHHVLCGHALHTTKKTAEKLLYPPRKKYEASLHSFRIQALIRIKLLFTFSYRITLGTAIADK